MRRLFRQTGRFASRHRAELIITAIPFVITLVVTQFLRLLSAQEGSRSTLLLYWFGILLGLLFLALLFNQARLFRRRSKLLDRILIDHFGYGYRDNQYFQRRDHYAEEKVALARALVEHVLPKLADEVCRAANLERLNVIIDSGTTLTPVFPQLLRSGLQVRDEVELRFYTNSMSGIDEMHRLAGGGLFAIPEEDFHLIGGQPLSKYRATTGEGTERFLDSLWEEAASGDGRTVTIGLVTANWLLMDRDLEQVQLCARGRGHLSFKKSVCANADFIVLVAPLGKLLRLRTADELNGILRQEQRYQTHPLPHGKRNNTLLLTSRRPARSLSPFLQYSDCFVDLGNRNGGRNFRLSEDCPLFDPSARTRLEALIAETPHVYTRRCLKELYGFDPT